ncbi:hypothetical protein [Edwardsiella tarda]|uniref:hypothetical protein n=1 Tax=Edwardsiella tarda TaxID=636 RepID=UPI001561BC10|nr:hypothetical protein [Edwardsiella tarda]
MMYIFSSLKEAISRLGFPFISFISLLVLMTSFHLSMINALVRSDVYLLQQEVKTGKDMHGYIFLSPHISLENGYRSISLKRINYLSCWKILNSEPIKNFTGKYSLKVNGTEYYSGKSFPLSEIIKTCLSDNNRISYKVYSNDI